MYIYTYNKITYIYIITRIYYTTWICGALWNLDPRIHHRTKLATSSPPTACHGRFSQGEHVIFSVPKTKKSHIHWFMDLTDGSFSRFLLFFVFWGCGDHQFFRFFLENSGTGEFGGFKAAEKYEPVNQTPHLADDVRTCLKHFGHLRRCHCPQKMAHFTVICKLRSKTICIWDRLGCLSLPLRVKFNLSKAMQQTLHSRSLVIWTLAPNIAMLGKNPLGTPT